MLDLLMAAMRGKRNSDPSKMLVELLKATGIQARELERAELPARFQSLSRASLPEDVTVIELSGTMQDGPEMHALVVIGPAQKKTLPETKKVLALA